ncbi:hypothetical protein Tco_1336629 [Tanacetum coccineum]
MNSTRIKLPRSFKLADEANSSFRTFENERLADHKPFIATFSCYRSSTLSSVPIGIVIICHGSSLCFQSCGNDPSYENSIQSQIPEVGQKNQRRMIGNGLVSDSGKISSGRKKFWGSNIGDSCNTGDGDKTVSGAIGACGSGIGDSLLVVLYACMTFIYGSSWKGEMASEAKRYLVKSSKESEGVFPGEAGK